MLQPDDVITKVNGLDIATIEDIPKALADVKAGYEVDVELRRGSDTVTGRVKTVLAEGEALGEQGVKPAPRDPAGAPDPNWPPQRGPL